MNRMKTGLMYLAVIAACGVPTDARGTEIVTHFDIPYAVVEGVDPDLLSLDIHTPEGATGAPVTVFIHGGSWRTGDKASFRTAPMPGHFVDQGFVFVNCSTGSMATATAGSSPRRSGRGTPAAR